MKVFIARLLFWVLLGIRVSASFAQPDQNYEKLVQEIEDLEAQVSVLQSQLQTVETVEKIELMVKLADVQAKFAEANTKLINAEFGKFERELKDSNDGWLWKWTGFFGVIIAVTLAVIGVAFWISVNSLIADRVEKSLSGFKEAVGQVNILKGQIKVLQKEHAVSVLEHFMYFSPDQDPDFREQIKEIPEEAFLQLFSDKTRYLQLKEKAAEVLVSINSNRLSSALLDLVNSVVDDSKAGDDWEISARKFMYYVGQIRTEESYHGLKNFLERLMKEDPEHKDLFFTQTVFSLADVSNALDNSDSASLVRKAVPYLNVKRHDELALENLVEYFHKYSEPEGMKKILTHGLTDRMPDVEIRCLELLQKYDPDFEKEWRTQQEVDNSETEETS